MPISEKYIYFKVMNIFIINNILYLYEYELYDTYPPMYSKYEVYLIPPLFQGGLPVLLNIFIYIYLLPPSDSLKGDY